MKKLLLLLPFLFMSCQKDNVEPSENPQEIESPIERFVTISNGLIVQDEWTTQFGYSSYSGHKGDLIWIRIDGCGHPMTNWQTGVTFPVGGPDMCEAYLNISGVGNRVISKLFTQGNRSYIIP